MKKAFGFFIFAMFTFLVISCSKMGNIYIIPNIKFFEYLNGDFNTKIIIIDKKKQQYEENIESGWFHGWTKDIIGDFEFIHIITENDMEGLFIIKNLFRRKLLKFDIVNKAEYSNKITNEGIIDPYRITIETINEIFEIKYDKTKYEIQSFFNYQPSFNLVKEEYYKKYDLRN